MEKVIGQTLLGLVFWGKANKFKRGFIQFFSIIEKSTC